MPFSVKSRHKKNLLQAYILENSSSQKLFGVAIGSELNFNKHVSNLCNKASKKIQTLARISPCTKATFNECLFFYLNLVTVF